MSFEHRWKLHIKDIILSARVGIHPHEASPQRLSVSVCIEGDYSIQPASVDACINYETVYRYIISQWPEHPHASLLEHRVNDLLAFIFTSDARITNATVTVAKLDIFPYAASVGVESAWSREIYHRYAAIYIKTD